VLAALCSLASSSDSDGLGAAASGATTIDGAGAAGTTVLATSSSACTPGVGVVGADPPEGTTTITSSFSTRVTTTGAGIDAVVGGAVVPVVVAVRLTTGRLSRRLWDTAHVAATAVVLTKTVAMPAVRRAALRFMRST
jgi:hypothetical protein